MAVNKEQLERQLAELRHELIGAKAALREARKRVEEIEGQYNGLMYQLVHLPQKEKS